MASAEQPVEKVVNSGEIYEVTAKRLAEAALAQVPQHGAIVQEARTDLTEIGD